MALRKYPYGYEMNGGTVRVNESEAELVRLIFAHRASGKSNWETAKELFDGGSEYFSDSVKKNSCKISAIIYDARYTGTDGYPQIIDEALFDKVQQLKGKAYCSKGRTEVKEKPVNAPPSPGMLIPSKAVFEKERQLKTMLQSNNADMDTIKQMILDIAEEKYNCIM